MNAALYIRVSTEDQTDYSPDAQKRLLLEYAKKNNLDVNEEHIFMDEGISGRKAEKRPQFMNMIALAKKKEKPFERILVWKFSRFARNQEESIVYKNMLRKDGVEVISISEPIIEGPFGSLIERIIEWMDEYYSIRLSGEVHRGMSEKARKGQVQANAPYGYKLENGNYIIVPEESEIIKYIFSEINNNVSMTKLCRKLLDMNVKGKAGGKWIPKRIKYIIKNPTYIGKVRWNYSTHKGGRKVNDASEWIIEDGTHEPIISKDVWKLANENIDKMSITTSTRPSSAEYKHWLGGLLRCSKCGGTLVLGTRTKGNGTKTQSFRCNYYNKGACDTSNYIRLEDAQELVRQRLADDYRLICKHKAYLNVRIVNSGTNEKAILEKQLEKVLSKYDKAKQAYLAEVDTLEEYKKNKSDIANEELKIKEKLESIGHINANEAISTKILQAITVLDDESISNEVKNTMLKSFIEKIEVNRANGTFDFYYYVKI